MRNLDKTRLVKLSNQLKESQKNLLIEVSSIDSNMDRSTLKQISELELSISAIDNILQD